MGKDHDPGRADEAADSDTPSAEPTVTAPLRPFGILSTFGWLAAALAAAIQSAMLVLWGRTTLTAARGLSHPL
jgi:hypothetical protein